MSIFFHFILVKVIFLSFYMWSNIIAGDTNRIEFGGSYLGTFNSLNQHNQPDTTLRRNQFDFATNFDIFF